MEHLVNLRDYTPFELVLFGVGCYMWVVVYIIYIRRIAKGQSIGMPVFAACSNFGWEIVWGLIPPSTDMGPLLVWAYRAWFFLDLYIIYGVYRYGATQVVSPGLRAYHKPFVILSVIGWAVLYYFFKSGGYDTPIGATRAYIAQMFISVLYLLLLLRGTSAMVELTSVTWLRSVGTGLNTIFLLHHYPDKPFLLSLGLMSLVIDSLYIVLTFRIRRVSPSVLPSSV